MGAKQYMQKADKKLLTVKISYKPDSSFSPDSNRFFIDFWDIDNDTLEAKYLVSLQISKNEALAISRDTGIKIFEQ